MTRPTMSALASHGEGGVQLREVPRPQPAPGRALIDARAVSVNRGELRPLRRQAGVVPGWDVAGNAPHDVPERGLIRGALVLATVDGAAWAETVAAPLDRIAAVPASRVRT